MKIKLRESLKTWVNRGGASGPTGEELRQLLQLFVEEVERLETKVRELDSRTLGSIGRWEK